MVALVAACGAGGGDPSAKPDQGAALTHEQYQQAIQQIVGGADAREATRLFTDAVATEYKGKECSTRVVALQSHLRSVVERAAGLDAPPDAADAQGAFVAAAQESVRLVGVAAADVASGKLTCGAVLNRRIYGMPSTRRAEAALTRLEKSGYVILGQ